MEIRLDDLRGPEIAALLQAHLDDMHRHSPPESVHALELDSLRGPDISFWTVWDEGVLMGCGALRELDARHGEIKSMRTDERYRRRGVATVLLDHIIEEARRRGYTRLSLETGTPAAFDAARLLYTSRGFTLCPPFGDYREDPYSVCMTLAL